jgi:hypothetical protein
MGSNGMLNPPCDAQRNLPDHCSPGGNPPKTGITFAPRHARGNYGGGNRNQSEYVGHVAKRSATIRCPTALDLGLLTEAVSGIVTPLFPQFSADDRIEYSETGELDAAMIARWKKRTGQDE